MSCVERQLLVKFTIVDHLSCYIHGIVGVARKVARKVVRKVARSSGTPSQNMNEGGK